LALAARPEPPLTRTALLVVILLLGLLSRPTAGAGAAGYYLTCPVAVAADRSVQEAQVDLQLLVQQPLPAGRLLLAKTRTGPGETPATQGKALDVPITPPATERICPPLSMAAVGAALRQTSMPHRPSTAVGAGAETQPARAARLCSAATVALLVRRVQREPSRAAVAVLQPAPLARVAMAARS